jgi:DNA-binding NarL/FixJ family response regulator
VRDIEKENATALKRMNVALIDDNEIVLRILKLHMMRRREVEFTSEFTSVDQFLAESSAPNFIFLDLKMSPINGIEAIPMILEKFPDTSIIIHSSQADQDSIFQSLQLGAVGYLYKEDVNDTLDSLLETVFKGGSVMTPSIAKKVIAFFHRPAKLMNQLSPREMDVTQGVLDGLSYKMIAEKHQISIDTVRMNIKHIYKKLNINSKGELFHLFRN